MWVEGKEEGGKETDNLESVFRGGKVKKAIHVLNQYAHHREDARWCGSTASPLVTLVVDEGEWRASRPCPSLPLQERVAGAYYIGRRLG
jgi:hypothetical protein